MIRIGLLAIALLGSACVKRHGSSGPVRSSGTVYRTTATGSAVGGVKGPSGESGRSGLFRAGLITLGAAYAGTVVGGQFTSAVLFSDFDRRIGGEETVSKLWIPVLGAWAALIHNEDVVRTNCNDPSYWDNPITPPNCNIVTVASGLIAWGAVAQTTGLVLTVVGLLKDANNKGGGGEPPRVVITPHGDASSAGLTLSGSF